jgi:ABC-2 type transport system ATP-binding protein
VQEKKLSEPIIEIQNFTKTYGDFLAVDDISFTVQRGEIFGLLGPNGAGKTSTMECLEGLRAPNDGMMRVANIDPTREPRKLRQLIGVQLQSGGMPEQITPNEAMKLFSAYHNVAPRTDLLDRLGLAQKRDVQFHALSTGQQRRLALALAVAHDPDVLFLDEPTAGLDVASRAELHSLMRELQASGTTILLATHDMAEAEEMADRVAILLHGKIAAIDTPMALTAASTGLTKISIHTQQSQLLTDERSFPAVRHRLVNDPYTIFFSGDIGQTVAALIAYVDETADTLIDLRVERPSLEDRFLELTQGEIA